MGQFTVLPDDIRDSLESIKKPSRFEEEIAALLGGQTIFVTDPPAPQTASSLRSVIRDRAPSHRGPVRGRPMGHAIVLSSGRKMIGRATIRHQAHRVERPTFLEVAVALVGLTFAAGVVIIAGWFLLTLWLTAIDSVQAAL